MTFVRTLFLDRHGRLRSGPWLLVFVGFIALTRLAYRPLKLGLQDLGADGPWLEPLPVVLILLATWGCTRLRREPIASIGLALDRRWWRELGCGLALGMGTIALVAAAFAVFAGYRFELDPGRSALALATGAWFFLFAALMEELLFRGFLFQRLVAGLGAWPAQLLLALLFAYGHWDNPGMQGSARLIGSIDLGVAAVMLGLAYLRTGSLALPIGLHLGWNFAQGPVLGFAVSGYAGAGWFRPLSAQAPEWLSGGAFGPEASVIAVVVDTLTLVALLCWRGTAHANPGPLRRPLSHSPASIELPPLTH